MASTQNSTADFQVSKNRLIFLSFPALFSRQHFYSKMLTLPQSAFTPRKKASVLYKFIQSSDETAGIEVFSFENSSYDQDL